MYSRGYTNARARARALHRLSFGFAIRSCGTRSQQTPMVINRQHQNSHPRARQFRHAAPSDANFRPRGMYRRLNRITHESRSCYARRKYSWRFAFVDNYAQIDAKFAVQMLDFCVRETAQKLLNVSCIVRAPSLSAREETISYAPVVSNGRSLWRRTLYIPYRTNHPAYLPSCPNTWAAICQQLLSTLRSASAFYPVRGVAFNPGKIIAMQQ